MISMGSRSSALITQEAARERDVQSPLSCGKFSNPVSSASWHNSSNSTAERGERGMKQVLVRPSYQSTCWPKCR